MIYVVTSVFISNSCPKFLQPVAAEMRKLSFHAFESEEHLSRYVSGLQEWVKELNSSRNNNIAFYHTSSEEGGGVSIVRNSGSISDLMRMSYFRLYGHVAVGKDNRTVYPQEFIKEGGNE